MPTGGPFVLLPGRDWREREPGSASPFSVRIIPYALWSAVTEDGALDFFEAWPVQIDGVWYGCPLTALGRKPRDILRRWPQTIGLRVAKRLVERGRVERVHLGTVRDARQLRTLLRAAKVPDIATWAAAHVSCPDDIASGAVRALMAEDSDDESN